MKDRIYRYLHQAGGEAPLHDVLRHCAAVRGGLDRAASPLADWIVEDPRFERTGNLLRLAAGHADPASRLLEDTHFVVVDLETTGTSGDAGITEIGAVRLRDGDILETFETLVDPGLSIPWRITQLTGISNEMLQGQPSIIEAWPKFARFLGRDTVIVAHNAGFDLRYLQQASRTIARRTLEHPVLCTVRLSRLLLPRLRSYGLDSVTKHLSIEIQGRHRALGDAMATARVLNRLLSLAEAKGYPTLGALLDRLQPARKKPENPRFSA